MNTALSTSVFENGRSQSVRIPKEYRFAEGTKRVEIRKVGDELILRPLRPKRSWLDFLEMEATPDFEPVRLDEFLGEGNRFLLDILSDREAHQDGK